MSVKLTELREPRLEASEPRLEAREPRLLPEEMVRVLADRLKREEQPAWSPRLEPARPHREPRLRSAPEEQNSASARSPQRLFNTSEHL